MTPMAGAVAHLSATPVVALAAILLVLAVALVFVASFFFYRRSGRR
jgi:hypothetical protein